MAYPLSDNERMELCQLMIPLLLHPSCSSDSQTRLATALNRVIKNHMTTQSDIRQNLSQVFSWRSFYDILHRLYFRKYRSLLYTPSDGHRKSMVTLIARMRRFFSAEVTDEVWNEFRPLMCPHDHMSNQAQGFLCLFLPTNNGRTEWLPEIFQMWIWNDNNPYWDFNFFYLLRRLAQDSVSLVDWRPHLELIFTRVLRAIDLPVGSTASRVMYNRFPSQSCSLFTGNFNQCKYSLIEHCAYLIVWMMSPKCPEAMDYLKKLFKSIESYYHPSNGGNWSNVLGVFLQSLCKGIARRVLNERNNGDCHVPTEHRLTDDQIKEFVELVLPIAQTAIYGKSVRLAMSAVQAIKHVTYLSPALVLPQIMERISEALQTLTETHQTTAAMGLLSVIIFPMMKTREFAARDYIHDLMSYSLPGIDANDPFKTYITIKFFVNLLTVVPLFSQVSYGSTVSDDDTGDEEDPYANEPPLAVQFFEDWCIELLNRVFRVFQTITIDRGSQQNENSDNNLPIRALARLMFMQLSPQLHKLCVRKVIEYLQNNFTPNADKFLGDICQSAATYVSSSSSSEDSSYDPFGMILDVFYSKLVDNQGQLNNLTDSELSYYVYLVAKTVQVNPYTLKHQQRLMTIIQLTWHHKEKKVIKAVGKLVKNLLQSLTTVYPSEYRNVKPSIWGSEQFQARHWKYWGRFCGMQDVDTQWHVPSQESLDFATLVYNTFSEQPLSYLQALPTDYNRHKLVNQLMRLRYVLRGSSLMLPEMNENVESQYTKHIAKREVNSGTFTIPDDKLKYTRYQVASILHYTFETLVSLSSGDSLSPMTPATPTTPTTPTGAEKSTLDQTKVFSLLVKCYFAVICLRGKTFSKTIDNSRAHEFTKRNLFKSYNEKQKYPRTFLVQRAHQILQSRVYMRTIPYTDVHSKLLEDLKVLALSEYSKVRTRAQGVLVNSLKLFTSKLFRDFLPDVISILSDSKNKNSAVNGAIYTLQRKSVVRRITDDWKLLSHFMTSVVQSHFIEKASIQNRLNSLFVTYSVAFKELKLQEYKNGHVVDHSEDYQNLVQGLLKILKESNMHWRYELMLYTVLVLLIRSDRQILVSMDVVKVFLKSLISDVVLLRTGSLKAMSMVLIQYKAQVQKRTVTNQSTDPAMPSTDEPIVSLNDAESYKSARFHDKNYYGWNCKPKEVSVYDYTVAPNAVPELPEFQKVLREIMFEGDWMEKFFEYQASQPRVNRVTFSDMIAQSLKGFFQILGIEFLEKSKPHFEKLFVDVGSGKPEERNALAFASEFIGALARGSKHWSFEDRKAAFGYILPHFKNGLMACSQSCIPDWHAALRFCVYDLDVRRCIWLRDALIQNLDLSSGTTATQSKSIGYLFPVLSEFSWRDPHTNQQIAETLFLHFDHPYQQVRQKIADTLTLNFRFMWRTTHAHLFHNKIPALESILKQMSDRLKKASAESNSDDLNSPAENLRKMCSSMIVTLVEMASNLSVIPYLDTIVPLLFDIYAETRDSELQNNVRRTFLSISASLFPGEYVTSTLKMLAYQKEHGNHKLRIQLSIFLFLQSFAYRHQFYMLHPDEENLLFKMLEDGIQNSNNEIEVRELACETLGDFIRIASDTKVQKFLEHFKKVAVLKKPVKKRRSTPASASQASTTTQGESEASTGSDPLYAVLGLSALIRSCPYEMPDWLPDVLIQLSTYQHYTAPKNSKINSQALNEVVKKTFAVFWKTQRDQWHISKKKLSEEQLFEVTSLLISPVYYV